MSLHHIACRASAMAVVLAAGFAGPAYAQLHPWTAAGSTGTVDEADVGLVDFDTGQARMRAAAAAGSTLSLRYSIVSLVGFSGPGQYLMRVRFRDNGAASRVQLHLRRYNSANGTLTPLNDFDSNVYGAAAGYQTQTRCIGLNWDFLAGPHYIEAVLTKSGAAGQPALATIQLIPSNCFS